ncbi:DUF1292 domain-containing protein [Tannockella kyphosi]|uniref:DUF1292 domain-containing protein n=1 Tax=Tannockella kyphosi TaxID=2899121 RepID=UPI002012BB5A|nr:DUF1292 domain-containing protein [Tannockella kyphosi]
MEANKIIVIDESGKEIQMEVLFTFDDPESGKKYVLYFNPELDEMEIFASGYDDEGNLFEVETPEEWEMIEEIFNTFVAEQESKEGHECCGGHGHHHDEDHECCGGHGHHEEGHECCGGHGHHEEGHECCGGHGHHEEGHECCGGHGHDEDHECCGGHKEDEEHECKCSK